MAAAAAPWARDNRPIGDLFDHRPMLAASEVGGEAMQHTNRRRARSARRRSEDSRETLTGQDSLIVSRPNMGRMRQLVTLGPIAFLVGLVVWWPTLGPALRFIGEDATDARSMLIFFLIGGAPALWLLAYWGGLLFRARLEIDGQSLRVTGALLPSRTVALARLHSILQCAWPTGLWGTTTPIALVLDRSGRSVFELSALFDIKRVAEILAVPLTGSVANRMTRADVETKYGVARGSKRVFGAVVIGMIAYTVAAIAFIIYVL